MTSKPDNLFKLKKPVSFYDLLSQIEFISFEIKEWSDKIIEVNKVARQNREIVSEDDTKDAFYNISQNIIDLSKLIRTKIKEV
ncbi:MAG TPA: hypothetical protein VMV43_04275 [Candidatus Nanopelagicaceae bacterium]|nr:hypothetical protein [Candidatus Nanopelagicaceae bacterium]